MTAEIWVCPQSRLVEAVARSRAGSVVTLLSAAARDGLPPMPGMARLFLDMSDLSAPRAGHVAPGRDHAEALIGFARAWDRRAPLLLHCYAGVSRSTAAAFAAVCALDPGRSERRIAADLRAASPSATPNPMLVAAADAVLGCGGRMSEAVEGIGRGRDCFEGEVFSLSVPGAGPATRARA